MAMIQWCNAAARRMTAVVDLRMATFSSLASEAPILCGRGDKRTKRGKRFKGSYGNSRPKKEKKIERIKDKVEVPRSVARTCDQCGGIKATEGEFNCAVAV